MNHIEQNERIYSIMKKMIILDLDGTLTNSKKEITPKTLEALLDAQERGVIVTLASGRPTYGIKEVSDALQLERFGGYILSFNGARVMNVKTKEVVYQQKFPLEYIRPLYEYAVEHDMGLVTYEQDKVVTGTRIDEYMQKEDYNTLKEEHISFQLNLPSLAGMYGKHVQKKAEDLLKAGMYDRMGGDTHSCHRYQQMLFSSIKHNQTKLLDGVNANTL